MEIQAVANAGAAQKASLVIDGKDSTAASIRESWSLQGKGLAPLHLGLNLQQCFLAQRIFGIMQIKEINR